MNDDESKTRAELLEEVRALRRRTRDLEAAQQRLAFLADAGALIAEALDYEEQVRRVARLVVPRVADWCAVDLVGDDGALRRLAVEHVDPSKVAWAYEIQRRYPPEPHAQGDVYEVLRTGRPAFYPEIGDDMLAHVARDEEHLRLLRAVGFVSAIVVPLVARGRVLGAITLVTDSPERRYGPDDVALAEGFARSAALVIDNGRLYGEMRRVRDEIDAIRGAADGGITVQEPDGRLVYANDAAAQLCGYASGQELLAAPLADVLSRFAMMDEAGRPFPLDRLPGRLALQGHEAPGTLMRFRSLTTGEERWSIVRATPICDDRGAVVRAVNTFQDVTAIKRAEQALRERDEWLSVTLASIGDAVIATDAAGRVAFMNQVAQALTGWPADDARGRDLADVFQIVNEATREPVESPTARVLREGVVVGLANHTLLIGRDGVERPIDDSGAPIRSAEGDLIGVVLVFRDITTRRQSERRLLAQYAVARVLAESEGLSDAMQSILRAVGESLGWDWGALWVVDQHNRALRCAATWQAPSFDAAPLTQRTRDMQLGRGAGLPGRVWASNAAAWIADIAGDANFPRAAAASHDGLRSAFAAPIRLGAATLGVIEFASRAVQPPDEAIMEMMQATGSQIGQFIERKRGEEVLDRYRLLSQHAQDIILFIDHDGHIVEANAAAVQAYGYTHDELLGTTIFDLRAAQTQWSIQMQMAEANEAGMMFETLHRRKDGQAFPVEVSSRGALIGGQRTLMSIIRDITERKRTEARQRLLAEATATLASSIDYETTLQNIARLAVPTIADWCAVHILESDNVIRRLAVAHVDPQKQALALRRPERYPLDTDARHIVPQVIRSGQPELYREVSAELLAASARDAAHLELLRELGVGSYMCVPMRYRGGVLGTLTLVADSSGRRYGADDLALAEELAQRAAIAVDNARLYDEALNAIRLRDQFLAIASHELKTPLTALLGQAQLLERRLRREHGADERHLHSIGVVVGQANRLNKMVTGLLDISRIEQGALSIDLAPLDLCELARQVVEEIQPTLSLHTIVLDTAGALLIEGDALRLEQVFQNLIGNAVKYSPEGGEVRVRVAARDGLAVLEVADQGIGIPDDALPRLFQRFFRAKNADPRRISGVGIGLYVVKEIVELHGGQVAVASHEGQGSTFTVALPLRVSRAIP
jgi:PAS domain S-box-containing protein